MTRLRQRDGAVEPGRIPGPGRQDQAVDLGGKRHRRRDRVGQDPNPGAPATHGQDDVRLQSEIDDPDQRATVFHPPDIHDRRRRHLADEVLVLPARHRQRGGTGGVRVRLARRGHDAAQAAVRAQVAGERAGVHAGDGRDRRVAQERGQLAGVVENGRRGVGHDERTQPRPGRLVLVGKAAVVADERVGHDDDLAGIRGVGADLLVAGLARVDDQVATRGDRSPERHAGKERAILERQQRRSEIPDPGIDDGARPGCRRHGSRDHAAPDTTNPPASGARWADACADIDASFAGLTGPVRQPHRTGHERTPSG